MSAQSAKSAHKMISQPGCIRIERTSFNSFAPDYQNRPWPLTSVLPHSVISDLHRVLRVSADPVNVINDSQQGTRSQAICSTNILM